MNPYESPATVQPPQPHSPAGARQLWRRVLAVAIGVVIAYYAFSSATLPWADDVWLGEVPLLAFPQLPKMHLKSVLQDGLIALLPLFGLDAGSPSPNSIRTHPWAMVLTAAGPPLLVIGLLLLPRSGRVGRRRALIAAVLAVATIDGLVTFWFDSTSRLSLF
ncbi:MAG: hypothetical protein J5I93_21225 [Pirellulaceae bacterium]|nr:hypothetical protein [Pirellulaceae bacterium]